MPRCPLTIEIFAEVMDHLPEGFISLSKLRQRFEVQEAELPTLLAGSPFAYDAPYLFDTTRTAIAAIRACEAWLFPTMPDMDRDSHFQTPALSRLRQQRAERLQEIDDPACLALLDALAAQDGYLWRGALTPLASLAHLLQLGIVAQNGNIIYDPLRLRMNNRTRDAIIHARQQAEEQERERQRHEAQRRRAAALAPQVHAALEAAPGHMLPEADLVARFDPATIKSLCEQRSIWHFTVTIPTPPKRFTWVCLDEADLPRAQAEITRILKESEGGWKPVLAECGDALRPGARDGKSVRMRVLARTYRETYEAAKRLGVPLKILQAAIWKQLLPSVIDPEGRVRIPVAQIEAVLADPERYEHITGLIALKPRDIASVCGVHRTTVRRRLIKAGISTTAPTWGEVRGQWKLPDRYAAFQAILEAQRTEWRAQGAVREAQRQAQLAETMSRTAPGQAMVGWDTEGRALWLRSAADRELARAQAERVRTRLVAAFPAWRHDGRAHQRIELRVGPTNSGKTYEALQRLIAAGGGWYLAPLRLLAYEVFERLNDAGIPCALLTGEEQIPVAGATITAATIEMFAPQRSGACVVIDEAHLLGDSDRGWAWTRALMEAEAPLIIVVGSPVVQPLVARLAAAAALPLTEIAHERLAPLAVAEEPWPLRQLPPQTILVAFSRRMTLGLKAELEGWGRSVSIVYGALPPEVRHRQAQRFAARETEICVATDAVGMGMNLPADYVCFYELEKFDGRQVRPLLPLEIHQIGGRAGRYGFSAAGLIGATTKRDLSQVRHLYAQPLPAIPQARVAPAVADLELIPGSLAARLLRWARLESIPDDLRDCVTTADLTERVALASQLGDDEVGQLGLAAAVKLCNAPTRDASREYWRACATALVRERPLPLPSPPPAEIRQSRHLDQTEASVACADVYLWLAHTPEFRAFTPERDAVRATRLEWSAAIDAALAARVNTAPRCTSCGRILPLGFRYRICEGCYWARRERYDEW